MRLSSNPILNLKSHFLFDVQMAGWWKLSDAQEKLCE